ncbi:MAG: PaaI family thioesterase [Acidimicrobiaceae bacterium]|nr:PaaI family thioesterase [Acidimicrobiaceae bacterium]
MSDERVREMNEFFSTRVPGLLGVETTEIGPERVVGQMEVTGPLIAGTGYLFAPAVIALADTLAAIGVGTNLPEGSQSFTTIELKANFLGSAREGERVVGVTTAAHMGRTTQVWDCTVTNATTGKTIALFRCTQMILYPPNS